MTGLHLPGKKYFQFIILTSGQKTCSWCWGEGCVRGRWEKGKRWLRSIARLKLVDTQGRKEEGGQKGSSPLQCCWGAWTRLGTSRGQRLASVPVLPALGMMWGGAAQCGLSWLLRFAKQHATQPRGLGHRPLAVLLRASVPMSAGAGDGRNNWLAAAVSMPTDLWGVEPSKRHSQMVSSNVPIFMNVFIRWHPHESRKVWSVPFRAC